MLRRPVLVLAAALGLASACGKSDPGRNASNGTGASGAPAISFDPDVPAWRGGCFLAGPAGKIVNGSPSPDVRSFGSPCTPGGAGGLVYLDGYDPVRGTGDVTVLSSAAGSRPVVIGPAGGAGGVRNGSTGARFDPGQTQVLTLARVGYVTGDLVLAALPDGAPLQVLASQVRVENYEFVPAGVLYVGNYDPTRRQGDLFLWNGAPQLLASAISRFDFTMYRLSPARDRVAYLQSYTSLTGGSLFVQALPPGPPPTVAVAAGVETMAWTSDGRLAYLALEPDGVTLSLWVWDLAAAPQRVATGVDRMAVSAALVGFTSGFDVIGGRASLRVVPAAGGADLATATSVADAFALARAHSSATSALAYVALSTSRDAGDLWVARLPGAAAARVDGGVAPAAGFSFSPEVSYVAYATGWNNPQSSGSSAPQPGIAGELKIVSTAGGAPFSLATQASMQWLGWDPQERFVAGLGAFDPASNGGSLVVKTTGGAPLPHPPLLGVSSFWFDFGSDGASLAAIRGWDDALQRGELVLLPTSGASAWQPVAIDADVTFYVPPVGGRIVYGVRGGGRDGLWLGGAP